MRYTGPKAKRCRRQGINLYGSDKYDKILQRKPYGPGKNPRTRQGKKSEYGTQLMEKQKVRDIYGITEKQLQRIYKEANRKLEQTDIVMKKILEQRLDNMLYRAGFALTRLQARQFISHGLFTVNDRRVTIASYKVSPGDKIEVRARSKSSPVFESILGTNERYAAPSWLKADLGSLVCEVQNIPQEDHLEQVIDMRKVVEFYSR